MISSVPKTHAASIGSAEFFAPDILTSPFRGPLELIIKISFSPFSFLT